jgi:hypothetical protein
MRTLRRRTAAVLAAIVLAGCATAPATPAIDNASIGQPAFREHRATYGLVYRLPKDVTDVLDNRVYPRLRERLVALGLLGGGAHVYRRITVVHIPTRRSATPRPDTFVALRSAPPVLTLTLKSFYTQADAAGAPWWFDPIVKAAGYTG